MPAPRSARMALNVAVIVPAAFACCAADSAGPGAVHEAIAQAAVQTAALPSWNQGAAERAIIAFMTETTTPGSPGFVPPADRSPLPVNRLF